MDWLKVISQGWIIGIVVVAAPVYAEPGESLYQALLQIAADENSPALNAQLDNVGPPVAPIVIAPPVVPDIVGPKESSVHRSILKPTRTEARLAVVPKVANSSEPAQSLELIPQQQLTARPNEQLENIQHEVVEERYSSGVIKIERQVLQDAEGNYVNDGNWRWFNPKGQIIAEGVYRNDLRDGVWRRMYSKEDVPLFASTPYRGFESPFLSEAVFKDGKLHGSWVISDGKNRKISEIHFEDGIRQGPATWWHVQGSPLIQSQFEKGALHGEVFAFSPEGKLASRDVFDHGRKIQTQTDKFSDGKVKTVASMLSGHWQLTGNDDWWTVELCKFEVIGGAVRHGKLTTYYRNGKVQSEQEFHEGKPTGQFTWWYENGQKSLMGAYANDGAPTGRWTWWHASGLKLTEGEYAGGAPTGTWITWDSQGKVVGRGTLEDKPNQELTTKPQPTFDTSTRFGVPQIGVD